MQKPRLNLEVSKIELFRQYQEILRAKIKVFYASQVGKKGVPQPPVVRAQDVLVEKPQERNARMAYMFEQEKFKKLLEKTNPGQIDYYQAVFGSGALQGELFVVID